MDVIIVLIPVSIVLVLLALRALSWSIDSGQFDDLDREAQRILFEDRARPAGRRDEKDSGDREGGAHSSVAPATTAASQGGDAAATRDRHGGAGASRTEREDR